MLRIANRWLAALCIILVPIFGAAATREEALQQLSQQHTPFTQTRFQFAIWFGPAFVVEEFLDAGMDANGRESDSQWPFLMRAAWREQAEVVNVLLSHGANPNEQGPLGVTALMSTGSATIANALIDAGAVVDQKDDDQATALMYAASSDRLAVLRVLLDRGADINAKGSVAKSADSTALHYAALRGHADAVKELIRRGADPNVRNANGMTPLMWAAYSADVPTAAALLDAGADPQALSFDGHTTSWDRAIFSQGQGIGVIKLLIERKANVNLSNIEGRTPLDFAKLKDDAEIINLLLANGAQPGKPF